jgi:hypothetical protein
MTGPVKETIPHRTGIRGQCVGTPRLRMHAVTSGRESDREDGNAAFMTWIKTR